jgi:hypothetical protein
MRVIIQIIKRVKSEHRGNDWRGLEMCPKCNGDLYMGHSKQNGHTWGECETEGCLKWVE